MAQSETKNRKQRRKEERLAKKKRKRPQQSDDKPAAAAAALLPVDKEKPKKEKLLHKNEKKNDVKKNKKKPRKNDAYAHLDADVAAALRRDDEEIAALEAKLNTKEKGRLNREYAKLECYGDDFGDFLDDLDTMVKSVVEGNGDEKDYKTLLVSRQGERTLLDDIADSEEDDDDEEVPMKEAAFDDLDEDDSVLDEIEAEKANDDDDDDGNSRGDHPSSEESGDEQSESDDGSASISHDDEEREPDHDPSLTYRPSEGEDIYGNKIEKADSDLQPKKYVPPHLRRNNGKTYCDETDEKNKETQREALRVIQRSLNSALNRLSEDTLIPVSQSISKLYSSHPTTEINECIWMNTRNACVSRGLVMTGLIPVYVAALAGVHIQKGDSAQLGEYLIEKTVTELWNELGTARESSNDNNGDCDDISVSKEVCNLVLLLCYMYNYGLVHCSLLYDLIRNFIENFSEIDIEALLLVLSHCGRILRSDDPMALKEIVLLVQKKALDDGAKNSNRELSSRVEFMVQCVLDLKNNKRRKQDQKFTDKTGLLRKALGQIKSNMMSSNRNIRSSESSLRISLRDILDAETKGRWWKVGASWTGNLHRNDDSKEGKESFQERAGTGDDSEFDEKLLKLAAKHRMNTDVRRSIFCIIMGSADYEDCFEKLVRAGMLKNRTERDTVRVLMECCGSEKSYNKFYSHLASRICEYQMQCKFTFQLAFWDVFKQFDELKARKAANLAKLLFHLVIVHNCLKLNVLKTIDMSSPEDLSETAMIFLTIFLSSILEYFDDPGDAFRLFQSSGSKRKAPSSSDIFERDDDMGHMDDGEALQANLTVFLVQILKASPKYKKGSKFRANLKAAIKACDPDNFF